MDKTPLSPSVKEKLSALNRAIFVQDGAEAAALYGAVLKEKSDFQLRGPVQFDLAQLLEKSGQRELALTAYETILEKQKDNKAIFPAMKAAGIMAFELKKFDKCTQYLGEFLKSKPPTAERQEAEEILSRLPPEAQAKRREAEGEIQLDKIPSSSWSIGETPKPVTFEFKVAARKTPQPGKPTPPPQTEPESIALDGFVSPAGVEQPRPAQPRPATPPPRPSPLPSTERPSAMKAMLAGGILPQQPDQLPPTQHGSSPALPTVPESAPMMTPPPMASPYYQAPAAPGYPPGPPQGWYPPPAGVPPSYPQPAPPMPPTGYPPQGQYGAPPAYPPPGYPPQQGYYPPPQQQMPPPGYPPVAPAPTANPSGVFPMPSFAPPAPPPAPGTETPEKRYERLRDERFALLIPVGKKIHLEAVADLVSRYEGISEASAKKKVLKGKGLLYSDMSLQEVTTLHPVVKLCRQTLVLVTVPKSLKGTETANVLRAERRDKGIKMTTDGAVRRMRWEEIRLINCGVIGTELMAVISGGEPMSDFRFRASSFDYSSFSQSGATSFEAGIVEFLQLVTTGAPQAVRSHIVEGLLQRKFTSPQPFSGWDEWDSYCDWVFLSHFAEKVDMDELVELNQVSSNW
ncbi:hypothetical protein GC173_05725 [bacterium]|nr:hypothetical protein [bacterium]